MPIKHAKTSAVADAADTGLVRPFEWNAEHTIEHVIVTTGDNTWDFGSLSLRWRDGHFGTSLRVGTAPATSGELRLGNTGSVTSRNSPNTADVILVRMTGADVVEVGAGAGTNQRVHIEGLLSVGTNPAASGAIRLPNAQSIKARNQANTADVDIAFVDIDNIVKVDATGAGLRLGSTAGTLGFFGSAPAAKPTVTGSRGGVAALADLLTDLATLGLITDSSTA